MVVKTAIGMHTTIWKKQLLLLEKQLVELPRGAEILFVADQSNIICIWYRCDPSQPLEKRPIGIVGTGHPAPEKIDSRYIGSVLQDGGKYIWHVFEPLPEPTTIARAVS